MDGTSSWHDSEHRFPPDVERIPSQCDFPWGRTGFSRPGRLNPRQTHTTSVDREAYQRCERAGSIHGKEGRESSHDKGDWLMTLTGFTY